MMEGKEKVECPVCQNSFDASEINGHVDDCLKITEDDEDFEKSTISRKRKSKSGDAWGCLQPRESNHGATHTHNSKRQRIHNLINSKSKNNDTTPYTRSLVNDRTIPTQQGARYTEAKDAGGPTNENLTQLSCKESRSINVNEQTHSSITSNNLDNSIAPKMQMSKQNCSLNLKSKPLAEQMRPLCFEDYVGQVEAVGENSMLRSLLQSEHIPSLILWGPPGCGKTTLARIIATNCKSSQSLKFRQLSAATAGVADVKEVIKLARNDQNMFRKQTVLFLDEIHRFNKTQQDSLLPHVEDGTIVLIGATTENPSFQVNSALLSRCRVIVLEKLSPCDLESILKRAAHSLNVRIVHDKSQMLKNGSSGEACIEQEALTTLANLCDGDARAALNGLQMAVQSRLFNRSSQSSCVSTHQSKESVKASGKCILVTEADIKEGLQRSHVLYDRAGEEHYNIISALHKSVRGSDSTAALYWLARMLEGGENPLYVARRLVRLASEDIGLADPLALNQAVAAYQACHFIGMPECDVILAQCVVYMCRAPKSVEVYKAYTKAKNSVCRHQGTLPSVPLHLRNAPTKLMKSLNYGKGYKYNPDYDEPVQQNYLPTELKGLDFFS